MSGQDLMLELQGKIALLDLALHTLGKRGRASAEAERLYRMELAKRMMIEREKGTPVTIINDICRGSREIARLRFDRDVATVAYDAAKEACNVYKLQIRVLESQIDREYRG